MIIQSIYGLNPCICVAEDNGNDKVNNDLVKNMSDEFIVTENNLSLKTARYKVDGKWVSYDELKEKEKEKEMTKQDSSSSQ